jgi:murein DD-endopeptidase MepM/ murein hydrolase activator NlpD
MRRSAPAAVLLALLLAPAAGASSTGGAKLPAAGGGTRVGQVAPEAPRPASRPPILRRFSLSGSRVRFRIDSSARRIRVRLTLRRPHSRRTVASFRLGARPTRRTQTARIITAGLTAGRYVLGISARDGRGRALRRGRGVHLTRVLRVKRKPARPKPQPQPGDSSHRFPLIGPFSYGGAGSRFGAGRPGHIHQGQDLSAAQGTPIVAVRSGTVKTVAYQAGGAGNYIVLHGDGENRDYVFMHLTNGSTRVKVGQHVRIGQRLGDVGSTGDATGPHLHFEVWVGGWYTGGKPIDPLPLLKSWQS